MRQRGSPAKQFARHARFVSGSDRRFHHVAVVCDDAQRWLKFVSQSKTQCVYHRKPATMPTTAAVAGCIAAAVGGCPDE